MQIENVNIDALIPYARNPRKNTEAVNAVAASIKEFGFLVPIVIDADKTIIAGHTRLLAAQKLELKQVPCVKVQNLSPQQIKAFRIIDNKVSEKAEWDLELLQLELAELPEFEFEKFDIDFDDVDNFIDANANSEDDEIPSEPEGEPQTQTGDIWLCGKHRVMCGDSTSADIVKQLIIKECQLVNTDPPYGVNHIGGTKDPRCKTYRSGGAVLNDDLGNEGTGQLAASALDLAKQHTSEGATAYIASPPGTPLPFIIKAMADSLPFRHSLVWVKDAFVFGRTDYHYRHELILYGWKEDGGHYFCEARNLDTVFEAKRGDKTIDHPTSKPIELFLFLISNSSKAGQSIYDPFLGSGTTLIAAHRLNRICYGMEISPHYCDVICQRFYNETGIIPTEEQSGRSFIPILK